MLRCPRCQTGRIELIYVIALDIDVYSCHECDATWFRREEIGTTGFVDVEEFMRSHRLRQIRDMKPTGWVQFTPLMRAHGREARPSEIIVKSTDVV